MYSIGNVIYGVPFDDSLIEELRVSLDSLGIQDDWDIQDPDSYGFTTNYSGNAPIIPAYCGFEIDSICEGSNVDFAELQTKINDKMLQTKTVQQEYKNQLDKLEEWAKAVVEKHQPKVWIVWSTS